MTPTQFVGEITADFLSDEIRATDESQRNGTTARYIIDCLHREQVAAIAHAIRKRPELAAQFAVKLPEHLLHGQGLPSEYLTRERATYYRHSAIDKPALLVANTGDDEEQSLRELLPVGDRQLRDRPHLWVGLASRDLPIGAQDTKVWKKALEAFSDLGVGSLDELARFTLRVRRHIEQDGQPLLSSLGMALPELKMPRNAALFHGIAVKKRGQKWPWKQKITTILSKQAPLLRKQHQSGRTLTAAELRVSFNRVREGIPESCHPAIETFITAPEGWNAAAHALAEFEWTDIKPLFGGLRKTRTFDFRKHTREFYLEREPDLLTDEEHEYLKLLVKSRRTTADEDDQEFFDNHRRELAQEHKLYAAWEKFIYRSPIETEDFVTGIALALGSLVTEHSNKPARIIIRSDRKSQKDYESLNKDAGRYFACRYRGLEKLFAPYVEWEVGELFRYESLEADWKKKKRRYGRLKSRTALQIKFEVRIQRGDQVARKRLVWRFNRSRVSGQLPSDLSRIAAHPLSRCAAERERVRAKGSSNQVDLQDHTTLIAKFRQQRGTLVSKGAEDIGKQWRENLKTAVREHVLPPEVQDELTQLFDTFEQHYTAAIRGFVRDGVACEALELQAQAFGRLLACVCRDTHGDRNRALLLEPLMSVGVAQVESETSVAIIAPWQPLRLAAIAQKARLVARLVKRICSEGGARFGDRRLYFQNLAAVLKDPFYPEVVVGLHGRRAELLALSDVAGDYTLHVPPVATQDAHGALEEDISGAARQVVELVSRFLKLYPHEQADLSVALFNPASVRTARTVVERLQAALGDKQDLRCRLILLHRDRSRLAEVYQGLVADTEGEEFMATDGRRDFISWLRIEAWSKWSGTDGIRPVDILFAQDAISRHASLKWRPHASTPRDAERLVPLHWSRRAPTERGMLRSAVYLTCPEQTEAGWAYLEALSSLVRGENGASAEKRLLPVVELEFQDQRTRDTIRDTHRLANWVANYDRLLDRAHLESQKIKVIRWKQAPTQGRSLLVSSNAETVLLKSLIIQRLERLGLSFAGEKQRLQSLANRMIDDASEISGDILLRAAKRGRSASELIGLVLSRHEIQRVIGPGQAVGWYFLDDCAAWLGQREGQLADILALCPRLGEDGAWRLEMVVSEAKYLNASSLAAKRRESSRQLLHTMHQMRDVLDEESPHLDRDLWLGRISDLLLDRIIDPPGGAYDSAALRRAIRDGRCKIGLSGHSHVFVWGPSEEEVDEPSVRIDREVKAFQEVYGPIRVRQLVEAYEKGVPLEPTPSGNGQSGGGDATNGNGTKDPQANSGAYERK